MRTRDSISRCSRAGRPYFFLVVDNHRDVAGQALSNPIRAIREALTGDYTTPTMAGGGAEEGALRRWRSVTHDAGRMTCLIVGKREGGGSRLSPRALGRHQ
jgi:hypothetical protein